MRTADEMRVETGRFVAFGPEEARKAREEAGLEPSREASAEPLSDVNPVVRPIVRFWRYFSQDPDGDGRKLWARRGATRH